MIRKGGMWRIESRPSISGTWSKNWRGIQQIKAQRPQINSHRHRRNTETPFFITTRLPSSHHSPKVTHLTSKLSLASPSLVTQHVPRYSYTHHESPASSQKIFQQITVIINTARIADRERTFSATLIYPRSGKWVENIVWLAQFTKHVFPWWDAAAKWRLHNPKSTGLSTISIYPRRLQMITILPGPSDNTSYLCGYLRYPRWPSSHGTG